ncbi:Uncharacterized conserved protein YecT, DUF1311 family [Faunimonas pinastri]|uniref:Uncharacterized conserved protein YecT, DUF1311 family n=1 Tax=Faunimonas pinastri TaxID=1855383 RepID=A0A1H9LD79_9HYPH|nr:lysozyme inhibitor LprI family protein [Faunimonas pinastri]SER09442.1 Uncharacterized conserved protein YecT, DUF1311 family [Faunimonas pinastri]
MKPHSIFVFGLVTLLVCFALPGSGNSAGDPAETACHQKDTTVAIVDCFEGLTEHWDKRLNTAYKAALKASESPARKDALIQAERDWVSYRKANCGWYAALEGTIREVESAGCMFDMTKDRTLELERTLQP